MSNLAEIEPAADALPPEQKQELMLFLAARLRAQGTRMPEPRKFSREQTAAWIAEDEADMQDFVRASDEKMFKPGVFLERERAAGRLKWAGFDCPAAHSLAAGGFSRPPISSSALPPKIGVSKNAFDNVRHFSPKAQAQSFFLRRIVQRCFPQLVASLGRNS